MSTADAEGGSGASRAVGRILAGAMAAVAVWAPSAPAAGAAGLSGGGASASIQSAGGPAGADTALRVDRTNGYPAVPADRLGRTPVGALRREGNVVRGEVGDDELVLRVGSPFVRRGGRVRQLANAPYLSGGRAWIPAELVAGWLRETTGGDGWAVRGGRLARPRATEEGPFRVVIDPGHGGRDPGAIGARGHREKNVTLAVARKMREELADEPGVEALLTRNRDTLIALQDRSQFAVEHGGDLFLSLHANASRAASARGFETYFLSPARTEEAREVAMRENASVKYERGSDAPEMSDLQFILADLDQGINVQESSRLAGFTQNALRPVHSGPDRGVKQAGFLVLVGASGSMPSVLVEMGFLTNPNEARVLTSDRGQEEIASSIAEAVVQYFHQYRRRIAGNRAGG